MKKKFKKIIAVLCVVATMGSIAAVSTSALTRRLYGDVNGDGIISNADTLITQKYIANMATLDTYQVIAADVNGDGDVNIRDVVMIYSLLDGEISEFPVGECFYY